MEGNHWTNNQQPHGDTHRVYGGVSMNHWCGWMVVWTRSPKKHPISTRIFPQPPKPSPIPGPGWLHWKSQGTWSPHGLPLHSRTAAKSQVEGGVDLSAVCSIDLPCCWEELVVRPAGLSNFVGLVQRLNVLKLEGELRNYKNIPQKKIGEFFVWGDLLIVTQNQSHGRSRSSNHVHESEWATCTWYPPNPENYRVTFSHWKKEWQSNPSKEQHVGTWEARAIS